MTVATVLIPTHDHGLLLRHSVRSALAQTISDIEVFIVGDGVPDITRELVADLVDSDSRVRFFDHAKGPRHGEVYRHEALASARGEIICYLSDDDLWFPDHLEEMSRLLQDGNFVSGFGVGVDAGSELEIRPVDLATEFHRRSELGGKNRVPLSCAGHTRTFYRQLEGWRTTPPGIYTDLYMWQQLLAAPQCRAASSFLPTVLYFPSPYRTAWSPEQRLEELELWDERVQDPKWVDAFRGGLFRTAMGLWIDGEIQLAWSRDHLQGLAERSDQARRQTEAQLHAALAQAAGQAAELARVQEALSAAARFESDLVAELQASVLHGAEVNSELRAVQATVTWRLRDHLLRFAPVRPFARAIGKVLARRAAR